MNPGSIRLRLLAAGAAAVVIALVLAALGLAALFEAHVERRAVDELSARLDQLAAGLERDPGGDFVLARPPADPRYSRPLSGAYWQIETATGQLRSRSLWDSLLPIPAEGPTDGAPHVHLLTGPLGESLLALDRRITLSPRLGRGPVRIIVAMDRGELRAAARSFLADLAPYLALLALALIAAGWAQVAVGLRPLAAIGARVAAVRSGQAARLGSDFPIEVRPLTAEVDALLAAREAEIARARRRAGDLAHGLKTPLQALMGEAERLRTGGDPVAAAGVEEIANSMRRLVDDELVRARIVGTSPAAAADPAAVTARVLAVLRRTPDGARLDWRVEVPQGLVARIDPADLTEALGTLLENAARHATARVEIGATAGAGSMLITVRDDGPGIPQEALTSLTARGARLDTRGDGLGLAIASDIAEAAGGRLTLANAAPGLAATLELPVAPPR